MDQIRPGRMFRAWRWLVFKLGDCKIEREPRCTKPEWGPIVKNLQPGDVILHRDERYPWTCRFLPGCMVHAGLYIGGGKIVEAVSEGVKENDISCILDADYNIIVRPDLSRITPFDRKMVIGGALWRAKEAIGYPYDPLFDFCDSEEMDKVHRFNRGTPHPDVSFCCTEVPHYAYMPVKDQLGLYRRRNVSLFTRFLALLGLHTGTAIVDADMYVTAAGFNVVWCSALATPEWAARNGASENFIAKILPFWNVKRITGQTLVGVELGAN